MPKLSKRIQLGGHRELESQPGLQATGEGKVIGVGTAEGELRGPC